MKTLFLGAYGFGNLGDELCLIEAMNSFPSEKNYVRTISRRHTSKIVKADGFIWWWPTRPKLNHAVKFDRVVLGGGGILWGCSGIDYMSWIIAAQNSGAETYVHNIGVGKNPENWITPEIKKAFEGLKGLSVRNDSSLIRLKKIGIKKEIKLTKFLETSIPKDMSLGVSLENESILGISIDNRADFLELALKHEKETKEMIYKAVKSCGGCVKVLPIISTVHLFSRKENDLISFKKFYKVFLKDFDIIFPETLDRIWWYNNMTPQRLKGLISKCNVLISTRKHNCIHSISSG